MSPREPITQRVAVFESLDSKFPTRIMLHCPIGDEECSGFVRITEVQEVTFQPLADDAVVAAQIAELSKARADVVEKFQQQLAALDGRIASLRAITHQVQE